MNSQISEMTSQKNVVPHKKFVLCYSRRADQDHHLGDTAEAQVPRLTPELMKAVQCISADMWPGIPGIPVMAAGGTDRRFLNNTGIWTYGISGMFYLSEGNRAHGLNRRLLVRSLYEGHEFFWRLGKTLAAAGQTPQISSHLK